MLSAMILSLIVGRGFLVHWPENGIGTNTEAEIMAMVPFQDLFAPPITIDTALVPDLASFSPADALLFPIKEVPDLFLCHDIDLLYNKTRFLIMQGNKGFIDILMHNEIYAKRRQELGISAKLVKKFGQCMLPPSKEVKAMVESFTVSHPAFLSHQIIGVHIRASSNHSISLDGQHALWKEVTSEYPANSTFYYFLASDSNSTLNNVPPEVQPYLLFQNGTEITRITKEGVQRALADIILLGSTIELFGERKTSFTSAVHILYEVQLTRKIATKYHKLSELPCFTLWRYAHLNLSCQHSLHDLVC